MTSLARIAAMLRSYADPLKAVKEEVHRGDQTYVATVYKRADHQPHLLRVHRANAERFPRLHAALSAHLPDYTETFAAAPDGAGVRGRRPVTAPATSALPRAILATVGENADAWRRLGAHVEKHFLGYVPGPHFESWHPGVYEQAAGVMADLSAYTAKKLLDSSKLSDNDQALYSSVMESAGAAPRTGTGAYAALPHLMNGLQAMLLHGHELGMPDMKPTHDMLFASFLHSPDSSPHLTSHTLELLPGGASRLGINLRGGSLSSSTLLGETVQRKAAREELMHLFQFNNPGYATTHIRRRPLAQTHEDNATTSRGNKHKLITRLT